MEASLNNKKRKADDMENGEHDVKHDGKMEVKETKEEKTVQKAKRSKVAVTRQLSASFGKKPAMMRQSHMAHRLPLDKKGIHTFEQEQLLPGIRSWFHDNLRQYGLTNEQLEGAKFDITNSDTFFHLLDSAWRKKNLTPDENKAVRSSFSGGKNAKGKTYVPQFNPEHALLFSGFGVVSHLRALSYVLNALPVLKQGVQDMVGSDLPVSWTTVPHLIYKPPALKKGDLAPHNDRGSWNTIHTLLVNCLKAAPHSVDAIQWWIKNVGIQSLAHLKGAGQHSGGHTTTLSPMTPRRYLILLRLVHPLHPHEEMSEPKRGSSSEEPEPLRNASGSPSEIPIAVGAKGEDQDREKEKKNIKDSKYQHTDAWKAKWHQEGGPVFYDWYSPTILKVANRIFRIVECNEDPTEETDKNWLSALVENNNFDDLFPPKAEVVDSENFVPTKVVKIYPQPERRGSAPNPKDDEEDGPYIAAWLNGFIHAANHTGKTPRLTVTLPVHFGTTTPERETSIRHAITWISNLVNGNHEVLLKSKKTFHGGAVHRTPGEIEVGLLKHFQPAIITKEQLASVILNLL